MCSGKFGLDYVLD